MVDDAEAGSDKANVGGGADMSERDIAERAFLSIARLLGRQVARQHFEESQAANDNKGHGSQKAASEGEGEGGGDWTCSPCLTISSQRRASRRRPRATMHETLDKFGPGPA